MSQQGADDWWQKLYEDPDAGPEPDPGDTLDNRFRSAAVVVTDPAGPPVPPAEPVLPGQRQGEPGVTRPTGARPDVTQRDVTLPDLGAAGYALWDTSVPADPEPPPRDPRQAGPTGYALGDVTVPPAETERSQTPVRRWGVPRADTPTAPEPAPEPKPQHPAPAAAPAPAHPAHPAHPVPAATAPAPADAAPARPAPAERPEVRHLGDRAPTYAAEPGALPVADPANLDELIPDTVLEGARHGSYTLRAASVRGDSARFRGEARRDFLLTARFGSGDDALVLVALAGGDRAAPGAREAAAEVCHWVASAIGRSQQRLADDIRAGRRDALRSGLQRLTDRGYGRLRARAAELGLPEEAYTAGLRGLLLPVDPLCTTRVCFGAGEGGLFRLRAGQWQDLEPAEPKEQGDGAEPAEGGFRFRFRAAVSRPGDTLLLCSGGLADPMREEALLPAELAARWAEPDPPGLAAFLADTQLRLKGYADDRTAAAVWEA
ncbi:MULTISPECIES: protein phosphatase 2C domain-containing protein [unclassified Streptomyces]|uniref:protein phosphatase 2C domain-containing protein n=1 Tax=unclassified Streptomyces TaxID=2593676 RepID=UPI001BECA088|nr:MULTISPECIES: protein phosphatase 2C domain-containing protein [unclassified Streptomyces]MBT2405079.1 protein phosphatase 2C domain-containing protein [Streptomyces sp. ISL-21]MBT2610805.1 protein phosphatase 2C domain-containing protein [Streptomyces sp. ISL-87]